VACQAGVDRAARIAREAGRNNPHTAAAAEGCGHRTAAAGEDTAVAAAGIAEEGIAPEEGTVGEAGSLSRVLSAVTFIGSLFDRLRILPRCCPDPA